MSGLRVIRPQIGANQHLSSLYETQAELDLSVGRSRLRGGFRILQHSVQSGAIKFFPAWNTSEILVVL